MQGWKHWLMGAGFFGFGMFKLFEGGSLWLVGLSVVAAAYLFYRALHEQTGAPAEDLELAVSFVRDPYETLFDHAVEQLGGGDDEPRRGEQPRRDEDKAGGAIQALIAKLDTREDKPEFDADAAIARYLANRPAPQPAAVTGFGRKRA